MWSYLWTWIQWLRWIQLQRMRDWRWMWRRLMVLRLAVHIELFNRFRSHSQLAVNKVNRYLVCLHILHLSVNGVVEAASVFLLWHSEIGRLPLLLKYWFYFCSILAENQVRAGCHASMKVVERTCKDDTVLSMLNMNLHSRGQEVHIHPTRKRL